MTKAQHLACTCSPTGAHPERLVPLNFSVGFYLAPSQLTSKVNDSAFYFTGASIYPTGPADSCPPASESSPERRQSPEDKPQVWTCPCLAGPSQHFPVFSVLEPCAS